MPVLWTANVFNGSDAAYIRVHLSTVALKIENGVAQFDMEFSDMQTLRDMLNLALERKGPVNSQPPT